MADLMGAQERPVEVEFRAAQLARIVYRYEEQGEIVEGAESAWVRLDGPWVHWLPDSSLHWMTSPYTHVVSIEWVGVNARERVPF